MNFKLFKKYILLLMLLSCFCGFTQTEKPKSESKIDAGFEGMIGLSVSNKVIALNVGGPSLKYKLKNHFKIGIGAFPSLIFLDKKIYPKLAFSPIVEHNKWLFIAPYYGYDANNEMIWTLGVGYKF
ncbi:hypothetical protein [Flavobacterium sp.]|uniref:hypothetical protein n=1 Tax=Flavobacterium sp. TaxID=239 RepID=UPI0038FCE266